MPLLPSPPDRAGALLRVESEGMIDWKPYEVATVPKDRELLIAVPNHLGTAYGGDGKALVPGRPYLVYMAEWEPRLAAGGCWSTRDGGPYDTFIVDSDDPSHWAEITLPEIVADGPAS
jgi:hypothetical protein